MSKEMCIQLVETVERHPCSYDYTTKDYSNERVKSKILKNKKYLKWNEIIRYKYYYCIF